MSRDLEEFLRMAAARRQAAQGNAPPPRPPQQQPPQQRPPQQRPPQRFAPPIVEAEVIEEVEIIQPLTPSIKTNISTRDIQEHVSHLGERVAGRSERVEEDIHRKFDHEVSRLDDDDGQKLDSPDEGTALAAVELVEMLRNPKTLAQAIILREILTRPDFD